MDSFFPERQDHEIKTEIDDIKIEEEDAVSDLISGDIFPTMETKGIMENFEHENVNPFIDNFKEENDIKIEEEDLPPVDQSSDYSQQGPSENEVINNASNDFEEEAILLLLLQRRRHRRQQQKRSVWMQPITSRRLTDGGFYTLMKNLRADNAKFFNYFRMSQESFNYLLTLIKPHIQKADTIMRSSIPAEERLVITLRYLVSGCSFRELHHAFRCGISTISGIINDVCEKIVLHLHGLCFPQLETNDWLSIAETFKSHANFPNCIGAIDQKYVMVTPPRGSSTGNFPCKKFFHLALMAVCDADYRLIFFDVNCNSKISDYSVSTNNLFLKKIQEKYFSIPKNDPVSVNGDPLPYVFVGDEDFQPSTHILTPYDNDISQEKKIFNYRLSRASRYIESVFSILTNKWHIFHKPLDVNIKSAENIVRACCILHNFVLKHDGVQFEDTLTVVGLDEGEKLSLPCSQSAEKTREKFAKYFASEEGSIPWQTRMIKE